VDWEEIAMSNRSPSLSVFRPAKGVDQSTLEEHRALVADINRRNLLRGGVNTPTRPPAENTAEKQRVRQQMLARNWHDDAISPELGSFCQKSHLIAGLIILS
jgi:hypothetical protein